MSCCYKSTLYRSRSYSLSKGECFSSCIMNNGSALVRRGISLKFYLQLFNLDKKTQSSYHPLRTHTHPLSPFQLIYFQDVVIITRHFNFFSTHITPFPLLHFNVFNFSNVLKPVSQSNYVVSPHNNNNLI